MPDNPFADLIPKKEGVGTDPFADLVPGKPRSRSAGARPTGARPAGARPASVTATQGARPPTWWQRGAASGKPPRVPDDSGAPDLLKSDPQFRGALDLMAAERDKRISKAKELRSRGLDAETDAEILADYQRQHDHLAEEAKAWAAKNPGLAYPDAGRQMGQGAAVLGQFSEGVGNSVWNFLKGSLNLAGGAIAPGAQALLGKKGLGTFVEPVARPVTKFAVGAVDPAAYGSMALGLISDPEQFWHGTEQEFGKLWHGKTLEERTQGALMWGSVLLPALHKAPDLAAFLERKGISVPSWNKKAGDVLAKAPEGTPGLAEAKAALDKAEGKTSRGFKTEAKTGEPSLPPIKSNTEGGFSTQRRQWRVQSPPEPAAKPSTPSPAAKPEFHYVETEPGNYHGSSRPVEAGSTYDRLQSHNLYGPGFYTTDNIDVAAGYTKKGKGGDPHLYKVEWTGDKPPVLLDLDKPLPPEVHQAFADAFPSGWDASDIDFTKPGTEVYKTLKGAMEDEGYTRDDAEEVLHDLVYGLQQSGYHGFSHEGGNIVGSRPHGVQILWGDAEGGSVPVKLTKVEPTVKATPETATPVPDLRGSGQPLPGTTVPERIIDGKAGEPAPVPAKTGLESQTAPVNLNEPKGAAAPQSPAPEPVASEPANRTPAQAMADFHRLTQEVKNTNSAGMFGGEKLSKIIEAGGYLIEAGVRTFAEWSAKMVEHFGDEIKPQLKEIWEKANGKLDEPPAEPSPAAAPSPTPEPKSTSLNNAAQAKDVKGGLLDTPPEKAKFWSEKESQAYGEEFLKDHPDPLGHAERLAEDVAKTERPFDKKESGIFLAADRRFKKAIDAARNAGDLELVNDLRDRRAAFLDNVQKGKTELASALNSLKAGADVDTGSFEDVLQAATDRAGGKGKLNPKEKARLEQKVAELNQAKADLDVARTKAAEAELKRIASRRRRQATGEDIQARRKAIRANISEILKNRKDFYAVHDVANVLGLTAKMLGQLVREVSYMVETYVEEGINTLPGLTDKLKGELPDGLTDLDIHDLISGYGIDRAEPNISDLQAEVKRLKAEARNESKTARTAEGAAGAEDVDFEFRDPAEAARAKREAKAKRLANLQNKIAEKEAIIKQRKFEERQTKKRVTPPDVERLENQVRRLDKTIRIGIESQKPKSGLQKILDWGREMKISGISAGFKIAGSGPVQTLTDLAADPAKWAAGKIRVNGKSLEAWSERSNSLNWKAITTGLKGLSPIPASKIGWKDFVSAWVDGYSVGEADVRGKPGPVTRAHIALASPLVRAQYEKAVLLRSIEARRQGLDLSSEAVMERVMREAQKDASEIAFRGPNNLSKGLNNFVEKGLKDDSPGPYKGAAFLIGNVLPVIKKPLNWLGQSIELTGAGLLKGGYQLTRAKIKGIDLTPQQAMSINRALSRGTVGAAVGLYVMNNREAVEKTMEGLDKSMFGFGKYLFHAPVLQSVRWWLIAAKSLDGDAKGSEKLEKLTKEVVKDMARQTPGMVAAEDGVAVGEGKKSIMDWLLDQAANTVLPMQPMRNIAQATDRDSEGNPVSRKASGPLQNFQKDVPIWRKGLPEGGAAGSGSGGGRGGSSRGGRR